MKTTKQDFELFQKEYNKWKAKFGLIGWTTYFSHTPLDQAYAQTRISYLDRVATVRLATQVEATYAPYLDVALSAKHEAIHLLIADIEGLAYSRYLTEEQITIASESLVRKLEELL